MGSYPRPDDAEAALRPPDAAAPARDFGQARLPARLDPAREQALVRAAQDGDPEALEALLRSFQRRVYAVCHRMVGHAEDAADLTQDTLVKVIQSLQSYDRRSAFSTWVIRIAMNASISALRKRKVRRHASLDDSGGAAGSEPLSARLGNRGEPGTRASVEHREEGSRLLEAMDDLDPQMKAILVLRDMQDLEYQQIGVVLEVPVGTVKSRLFRARAALRKLLENDESTEPDGPTPTASA